MSAAASVAFGASMGKPVRGREPIYSGTSTSDLGSSGLPSFVGARRGGRRDVLSKSQMQGDPHIPFDEQGVATDRLVSPTFCRLALRELRFVAR